MRKQDIDLNTIYCETAPMSFGREPARTPRKIRFLSTERGPWVILTVATANRGVAGGAAWVSDPQTTKIVHERDIPAEAKRDGRVGAGANQVKPGTRVLVASSVEVGGLPAQVWRSDQARWQPYVAVPAAVHRTWAEYEATQASKQAQRQQQDIDARIPEIQALLQRAGLDHLLQVQRRYSGVGLVGSPPWSGELLERLLTEWLDEKGL